ncbi:ligase-associated DNA damage response DEXH box helicase [Pigmentiphaga soli]
MPPDEAAVPPPAPARRRPPPRALSAWLRERGWRPFGFQREVWDAVAAGESGLLHATTGAGKTYAVWLGALLALAAAPQRVARRAAAAVTPPAVRGDAPRPGRGRHDAAPPLTVLWLTPMRALAADTLKALAEPLPALAPAWTLGMRTGDTGSAERAAQARRLPTALVTTPESLSLLLSQADAARILSTVRMVVADEWHELLGNKRGVQLQLALARLRRWCPGLRVWGLSATLGNVEQAMDALLAGAPGRLVRGREPKTLTVDTLLPDTVARFPWAGHLGLAMVPKVAAEIASHATTLVFTNTRSQAELWYQALLDARPDWAGSIALHHGSLDKSARTWVEDGLKAGALKAVVCTSSLDLGVDFLPVERVLQIGSAKGVARLLQRAGRSGHAPGRPSRITLVPTHSLEIVEGAAARAAAAAGRIEAREPPEQPLDVLVQHLVTVALGGGFTPDDLYREVTSTVSYRGLSARAWAWCLDFVRQGGASLAAYPDYRRVAPDADGIWRVPDARLARRHRMGIGTIVSDASMQLKFWRSGGAPLGSVEESFIARLRRGDCFLFGGRVLELVRVHEMTAYVRRAAAGKPAVPRWNGGRMPLSSTLADAVVTQLQQAADGIFDSPEMRAARPLLDVQRAWSALPTHRALLAETLRSREGWHLFLYPFAGRQVHLGLASLLAWRLARMRPATFSMAVNDYGLELLSPGEVDWAGALPAALAADGDDGAQTADLLRDVLGSLNAAELSRRHFREIARISGLIFQGYPGAPKSTRQVQASAGLFYEVFRKYDPGNLLLDQAEREVLSRELEIGRLRDALQALSARPLDLRELKRPTPFALPLMVERFREKLSSESMRDRIARMVQALEAAADASAGDRR